MFTDGFQAAAGTFQQRLVYSGGLGSAWIWQEYSTYERLAAAVLPKRCGRCSQVDGGLLK